LNLEYALIDSHFENEKDQSLLHGRFIPYGLAILDNALRTAGYQGELLLSKEEYKAFVDPDNQQKETIRLIGISSTTITRFDAKAKIEECRARFPSSTIVAGGHHFGNCAEDALTNIPQLDIVVRGEGDDVIVDIMRYAYGLLEIHAINGISYRDKDGAVVSRGPKLVVENLPSIEFIEKFYSTEQFVQNPLSPAMPIPSMNIFAGRGCPHNCIFCSVNRTKHRRYPVVSIVDLIESTTKKYNIRGVKFYDDSLTLNESYIRSLCGEIMRRNLDIVWFCDSRANINLDLLSLMHSAGCRYIAVGLETGSPRIQKTVGKHVTNEQVMQFALRCHEVGISTYVFLMASFPDETPVDLELTVDIARDLSRNGKAIAGTMGVAVIFPGTQLETIAMQRGILAEDFSWHRNFYNELNLEYDASPIMPLYLEGISPEVFKNAKRKMLANYANSLGFSMFFRNAVENILRRDISWAEKIAIGGNILKERIKSVFS
jgi:radical SAM superfamily enzyme YgiQ (UPF0313 family)